MGLTTGALQIGRSALLAYQSALQVVGNNVSNAGSSSYTRQTPVLLPSTGINLPEGFTPGGGVTLSALRRNIDNTLENRLRVALGDQQGALTEQATLGQIEGVLNEFSDTDLSTLMQGFFNAFSDLQNQPHDLSIRSMTITAGDSLVQEIRRQRDDVLGLHEEINEDLKDTVTRANELCEEVAELNAQVTATESTAQGGANSLRDQRDALLRELGELVQIEVRDQPDGGIIVYLGNEPLIQNTLNRGLAYSVEAVGGHATVVPRFADNNGEITINGGQMEGLIAARDTHVLGHVESMNSVALALVNEVNKVHAKGQGLEGFSGVTGSNAVLDSTAALNSAEAGLQLTPQNGSFLITVTNRSSGVSNNALITVDLDGIGTDDSLASLVDQINAKVNDVTAEVTADNKLKLTASADARITFSEDSSNSLAALGVNTFFAGKDAEDISINSALLSSPNLLAAATQRTPGDGSNAGRIASLGGDAIADLRDQSLMDCYNTIASQVAVKGSAAMAGVESADAIVMSLSTQRESISGVSLDEETISLLRFERSFQGAARYAATVDRLIQEMLSLV